MSDRIDPAALVQDYTWTGVFREYPQGVPEHLRIKSPPPGYELDAGKRFRKYTNDGFVYGEGLVKALKETDTGESISPGAGWRTQMPIDRRASTRRTLSVASMAK